VSHDWKAEADEEFARREEEAAEELRQHVQPDPKPWPKRCEADLLAFEGWGDDEVDPCDGPRELAYADRWLCRGCWSALLAIRGHR
jgi:hypothetical protein